MKKYKEIWYFEIIINKLPLEFFSWVILFTVLVIWLNIFEIYIIEYLFFYITVIAWIYILESIHTKWKPDFFMSALILALIIPAILQLWIMSIQWNQGSKSILDYRLGIILCIVAYGLIWYIMKLYYKEKIKYETINQTKNNL